MKKGIGRIVAGIIMILLQIMSLLGNAKQGIGVIISTASAASFLYSISYLIGYLLVGIIGLILLIWGIKAYNK